MALLEPSADPFRARGSHDWPTGAAPRDRFRTRGRLLALCGARAAVSRDSHEKRQREKKRQERAAQKRERRETRGRSDSEPLGTTEDELMERYRVLSEARVAGSIDARSFEAERRAIFAELGLVDPFDD
jgi:hypothetical protein